MFTVWHHLVVMDEFTWIVNVEILPTAETVRWQTCADRSRQQQHAGVGVSVSGCCGCSFSLNSSFVRYAAVQCIRLRANICLSQVFFYTQEYFRKLLFCFTFTSDLLPLMSIESLTRYDHRTNVITGSLLWYFIAAVFAVRYHLSSSVHG